MSNELDDINKNIKKSKYKETASKIQEIYDSFKKSETKPTIDESIFVTRFLPYFKKLISKEESIDSPITLEWMYVSGSLFNDVDVTDRKGDVLFTVPPIICRSNIDSNIRNANLSEINREYNRKSNRTEVEATNYLNKKLAQIGSNVSTNENIFGYADTWKNIFKRYDTSKKDKAVVQDMKKTTSVINEDEDVFDYT